MTIQPSSKNYINDLIRTNKLTNKKIIDHVKVKRNVLKSTVWVFGMYEKKSV